MEKTPHAIRTLRPVIISSVIVLGLLMVPLIAMQFSEAVDWGIFDFVVAATLLFAALFSLFLVFRLSSDALYRLAGAVTVCGVLLLIWVVGAVGIIGASNNDANLLFGGVVAVGLLGSLGTLGKAQGMRFVLGLMAVGQLLICWLAVSNGWAGPEQHPAEVILGGGVFVLLFGLASGLFHLVARSEHVRATQHDV
jgi:hypothetical protein